MAEKADIGVVRNADGRITAIPTISDIGVPISLALVNPDHQPMGPAHKRNDTNPAAKQIATMGIGVPYNPDNGTTTT